MAKEHASNSHFKLGRLHRSYDPRIPHLSALLAGKTLPPPPAQVDYTKGMPTNLGMMLNNTLGDCTCAAVYHAIQVWTFNATKGKSMETEPDSDVEKLYELACGYKPSARRRRAGRKRAACADVPAQKRRAHGPQWPDDA